MKKILCVILTLFILISLSGCQSESLTNTRTGKLFSMLNEGCYIELETVNHQIGSEVKIIFASKGEKTFCFIDQANMPTKSILINGDDAYIINYNEEEVKKLQEAGDLKNLQIIFDDSNEQVDSNKTDKIVKVIDGKNYDCEGYEIDNIKTYFCYQQDNLEYILNEYNYIQFLFKVVKISSEIDEKLFELPSEYKKTESKEGLFKMFEIFEEMFERMYPFYQTSRWAQLEVDKANLLGIIPNSLAFANLTYGITREEFAEVAVRTYEVLTHKKAETLNVNPFTDTDNGEILKAYNLGITTGITKTTFGPKSLINREQAATMLTRVFIASFSDNERIKQAGIAAASPHGDILYLDIRKTLESPLDACCYKGAEIFADDNSISKWAKDSVYFMSANGIINGVGKNKFAAKNITTQEEKIRYANATREQSLIIALRMIENIRN